MDIKVANEMAAPEQENALETAEQGNESLNESTEISTEATSAPQTAQAPVEDWKPDFKLKVMDKDLEWNEHLRKIANKDNFNELKEIQEKAFGLPYVKERFEQTKEEVKKLKEIERNYQQTQEFIGGLSNMLDKKDYFNFFNQLGLKDQEIINYALQRVKYHELPADEKQVYDSQFTANKELYELKQQNMYLANQFKAQQAQIRQGELNNYLQREDVRQIAEAFDARVGQPGSFIQEVIRRGQLAYYQSGVDLPVADAVREVVTYFGGTPQPQQTVAQPQASVTRQVEKPVIPNIKSGTQSPAKKVFSSIDDLKKYAASI